MNTIFWQPLGYSFPAGYRDEIVRYLRDVAASAWSTSDVYADLTQYYDVSKGTKRFVSNDVTFGGVLVDHDALPVSDCENYRLMAGTTTAACLTDAEAMAEIGAQILAHRLPGGLEDEYFLFTPPGLGSCFSSSSSPCYDQSNGYCAYHAQLSGADATYANVPFAGVKGCTTGSEPNGGAADDAVNLVSHEQAESMTDPLGTAWFDESGDEVADECDFRFGKKLLGTTPFGGFDQVIAGGDYYLQGEWSDRRQVCVWRNTFPTPVASITASSERVAGAAVRFQVAAHERGTSSFTYLWSLGEGVVRSGPDPTTTYARAGTYDVSVVVFDGEGDQARAGLRLTIRSR